MGIPRTCSGMVGCATLAKAGYTVTRAAAAQAAKKDGEDSPPQPGGSHVSLAKKDDEAADEG